MSNPQQQTTKRFPLGQICYTPGVAEVLTRIGIVVNSNRKLTHFRAKSAIEN